MFSENVLKPLKSGSVVSRSAPWGCALAGWAAGQGAWLAGYTDCVTSSSLTDRRRNGRREVLIGEKKLCSIYWSYHSSPHTQIQKLISKVTVITTDQIIVWKNTAFDDNLPLTTLFCCWLFLWSLESVVQCLLMAILLFLFHSGDMTFDASKSFLVPPQNSFKAPLRCIK